MDFKTLCKARYSVRAYKPDAIPAETMEYIKECTRLAPSAVNKQPWKFILFTGEDDRARMQQCYDKEWFREAPAYILVCENHGAAWTRRYDEKNHADIDVAIAIEHLCLAAAEQGLGTCWVCNFSNCPKSGIRRPSSPSAIRPHRTSLKRHVRRRPKYGKTAKTGTQGIKIYKRLPQEG